jgi:hypothetical protein
VVVRPAKACPPAGHKVVGHAHYFSPSLEKPWLSKITQKYKLILNEFWIVPFNKIEKIRGTVIQSGISSGP